MTEQTQDNLSRRERQIMDIIYQKGSATAAEVLDNLPDPPSYSAVRALLRVLETKGHLKHRQDGPRYIFSPKLSREKAKKSALRHLVRIFFDGSTEEAVAALLNVSKSELSDEDLERLKHLIDQAKQEGR
ncbi:MAG: BlaI/MecI/CopY family transcriptional regulator [Gemmatimonadota bacterium]|nr:MAG: BlaI/MecI/CopY family transcriptional regulator [Gemmatimonadota bacterium]